MSTVFEMRDSNDRREQLVKRLEVYTDSDWASDQTSRKSTSGAVIMAEGMRLHAHSRGQPSMKSRWTAVRLTHSSIDEVLDA